MATESSTEEAPSGRISSTLLLYNFMCFGVALMSTRWIVKGHEFSYKVSETAVQIFLTVIMTMGIAIMAGIWKVLKRIYYLRRTTHPTGPLSTSSVSVLSRHLPITGIYIFGGGSVILDILHLIKSAQCIQYGGQEGKYSGRISTTFLATNIVFNIVKGTFFVVQVAFLNRFSKLCLGKSRWLSNAIFKILATNISIWMFCFLEETHGLHGHHSGPHTPHQGPHVNIPYNQTAVPGGPGHLPKPPNLLEECINGTTTMDSFLKTIRPYLYPFTMEYSILSSGLLFHMWLAQDNHEEGETEGERNSSGRENFQGASVSLELAPGQLRFRRCGLIFNIALVLTLMHIIFAALLYDKDIYKTALYIHNIYQLFYYALNTIACIVALKALQRSRVKVTSFTVGDFLLLISSMGEFLLLYYSITASFAMILKGYFPKGIEGVPSLVFVYSSLDIVFIVLQTSLLIRAKPSASGDDHQKTRWRRPGTKCAVLPCSSSEFPGYL